MPSGIERRRRSGRDVVPAGPDTPGKHGKSDRERCGDEPRPPPRPRDDERRARARTPRRRCPRASCWRPPRAAPRPQRAASPAASRSQSASSRAATATRTSSKTSAWGASRRSPKRGTTRTSSSGGQRSQASACRWSSPASGTDGSDDDEPELHVQRHDVRAAHRVEGRRVEDGLERRIRRVRRGREEARVQAVEEEDRHALRHPEGPGVVLLQAQQPRRPEQRLEEQPRERDARRPTRAGSECRRLERPCSRRRPRSRPETTPAAARTTSDTTIPTPPNGTPDYEQRRPQHAERGQAERGTRAPRAGARQPHVRNASSPQRQREAHDAYATFSAASPASARTVTVHGSGSRDLRRNPPTRAARRGTRCGRTRSRGSTARRVDPARQEEVPQVVLERAGVSKHAPSGPPRTDLHRERPVARGSGLGPRSRSPARAAPSCHRRARGRCCRAGRSHGPTDSRPRTRADRATPARRA